MRVGSISWRHPAAFALLAALGGLLIAGPVGGMIGLAGGVAAVHRPHTVLLSAAAALVAAALLTVIEEPLTTAGIPFFPENHPLAELAGKLAAVLLLCGLAANFVLGERRSSSAHSLARVAEQPATAGTLRERVSTSAVAPALAAALVGALSLPWLGDRVWSPEAFVLVALVLALIGALLLSRLRRPRARPRQRDATAADSSR